MAAVDEKMVSHRSKKKRPNRRGGRPTRAMVRGRRWRDGYLLVVTEEQNEVESPALLQVV